jgi:hypothetical protein
MIVICGLVWLAATPRAQAAAPATAAANQLDDARRRTLIDKIEHELDEHYIFPDVGRRMIDALEAHAKHGDDDKISDCYAFAVALLRDLRAVSHDLHLQIFYGPWRAQPSPAEARAMGFGLGTIERLPGNVARVVINGFMSGNEVRAAIASFMGQVADAAALIVDLRNNHGGDSETVAFVASYVFDATPVHINDMYVRDSGETLASWTLRDVGVKPDVAVSADAALAEARRRALEDLSAAGAAAARRPSR